MLFKSKEKDREKTVNERDSRGDYAPVLVPQSGMNNRVSLSRRLLQLSPMVGLLLGGLALALIHHLFYMHLNGKSVDPGAKELPTFFTSQRNANFIGTTIAHGARIMLSVAIGMTFIQMFWGTLRARMHPIAEIDSLIDCGQSPFQLSAFRAAKASYLLYSVSLAVSSMAIIVILSPGSLTVSTNFQQRGPCTVPTVPQDLTIPNFGGNNMLDWLLDEQLSSMLLSKTYFPPFQNDLASMCGGNYSTCHYNLSFVAPVFNCADVPSGPFNGPLQPAYQNITPPPNAIESWTAIPDDRGMNLTITTVNPINSFPQTINCTAYSTTYEVTVTLEENGPATIQILNAPHDSGFNSLPKGSFAAFYAQQAMHVFPQDCYVGSFGSIRCNAGLEAVLSLFVDSTTGIWSLSDSVSHFITSFMQNASISLLSGNINYGITNDTTHNFQLVNSTCSSPVTVYNYNKFRLLLVYGVALAITSVLSVHGCQLILHHGIEHNLTLMDLVKITSNNDMIHIGTNKQTKMQLSYTANGQQEFIVTLKVEHHAPDDLPGSTVVMSDAVIPTTIFTSLAASSQRKCLDIIHLKMVLFILGAVSIMVLNHAYYHFLHGKMPDQASLPLAPSEWLLSQRVVSSFGNALAYVGQTFLAIAIVASSKQLFWYTLRHKGYSISGIDSVLDMQRNPFSLSTIRAIQVFFCTPLLVLLAASASLISIIAPSSIKVAPSFVELKECAILAPQDLSTIMTNATLYNLTEGNRNYLFQLSALGTYLPPINNKCDTCSYNLQIMGPGLDCEEKAISSNYSDFNAPGLTPDNTTTSYLYYGDISQSPGNLSASLSVQTWDVKKSQYQAVECASVLRSYSVTISKASIDVTETQVKSNLLTNVSYSHFVSEPHTLMETFAFDILQLLNGAIYFLNNSNSNPTIPGPSIGGGIGSFQLDGNLTWNTNLALALEEYSQNATLSILSGKLLTLNPEVPNILQNATSTCAYTFTAYEYTPRQLFLTYGLGIFITVLCVIWGWVAIWRNGVVESMSFSRMLRAVLNERMYNARDSLNGDTVIKADETPAGVLAPIDL